MTKASPLPLAPTSQTTSAVSSTDDDDATTVTTAKATVAATAPTKPPPPSTEDSHEECVLCCYPLPVNVREILYKECCGEVICTGCLIAQRRTLIIGTNVKKPIAGSKEEELEFMTILASEQVIVCPFCRAKEPSNPKEHLKMLWERIDEYKDPKAMVLLGDGYLKGVHGLSKNLKKSEKSYQQAYDLGDHTAAYAMANLYTEEIPDQARMIKYLEEGVKRNNASCMNNLAVRASEFGNHEKSKRLYMMAARSGDEMAMNNLMKKYRTPGSVVSKDDLATTLRAHKAVHDAEKSEPREYAKRQRDFREKVMGTN